MADRPLPALYVGRMNFGAAVEAAQMGAAIRRLAWNDPEIFVVYMPELRLPPYSTQGTSRKVNDRTAQWIGPDTPLNCRPYFAMYSPRTNEWIPGWTGETPDHLADDWIVVPYLPIELPKIVEG